MSTLKVLFLFVRFAMVNLVRRFLDRVGGELLSKRAYKSLISQRDRAVISLREPLIANLRAGVTGVVFSRDRAHQLDVLLRSYVRSVVNPARLYIIYSASTEAHLLAYSELQNCIQDAGLDINFVREIEGFRMSLIATLELIETRNIFFLVDDIVFIRNVNLDYAREVDPLEEIFSLRLSPKLRRSYTSNQRQMPPTFSKHSGSIDKYLFDWFEKKNEWSYPWSLDGHVLSLAEVRIIASVSDFLAPNTLEAALTSFDTLCIGRKGSCLAESTIVNLPINRVQNEISNLSGSVSPEYLLKKWREGLILDVDPLWGHIPLAPHEEHELNFVAREQIISKDSKLHL
jgi:hypothetical protein